MHPARGGRAIMRDGRSTGDLTFGPVANQHAQYLRYRTLTRFETLLDGLQL